MKRELTDVLDGDDEDSLAHRVLAQEHLVYPAAVRWFAEGRLRLVEGRVLLAGQDATPAAAALVAPAVPAF